VFAEQRKTTRKVLKTKAAFIAEGAGPLVGRTSDLSSNGLSINFADPLPAGKTGHVVFDIFVDGKLTSINARSKAMYCIFSGGEFKVGFEFVNLDLGAMTAIARFLR
jgi:hypothetical protein